MARTSTKKRKDVDQAAQKIAPAEEVVESIKGFDADLSCRGFKFEIGKTYETNGKIVACKNGFHAISGHPLEIFNYYPPAGGRYAIVKQSGALARHDKDSKVASAKIAIEAEIALPALIERAVKWVFDRAKRVNGPAATGDNEKATASGTQGAATASGTQGAATASGYQGAATASRTQGAATASGYQGAATASGYQGAATASGYYGKARGINGCAIFLVYRDPNTGDIKHAWAGIAGRDDIKPDTFYTLGENGKPVEAK